MNRHKVFVIILTGSIMSACPAFAQNEEREKEWVRAVLSKVTSIGTSKDNSIVRAVSARGVQMSALVTGERWTEEREGTFSPTEKITQLNFVLPSRMSNVDINTTICLERLEALRASGADKSKLELNFAGYCEGEGNYIVTDVLGCGDISPVKNSHGHKPTAQPTLKPIDPPVPNK
jgi:hypothetical protein